uniref:Uncharacterized protein n=1 Tax=Rhizophora mucronata TaxID=61149 RepID=A0A2P2LXJ7_RHIMU
MSSSTHQVVTMIGFILYVHGLSLIHKFCSTYRRQK